MSPAISFVVPGKPCAKQSMRFTKEGRRYQPADVIAYRDKIGWYARQAHAGMLEGPLIVEICARFLVPRSWSKKRQESATHHTNRPDVDNLTKAVLDGLKGVLIRDDAQVSRLAVAKRWSMEREELAVRVWPA